MRILLALSVTVLVMCSGYVCAQSAPASLLTKAPEYQAIAPVELLEREAFLAQPAVTSVLLAPDGVRVAYLVKDGHHTALYVLNLQSGRKTSLFSSATLRSANWTHDSNHLLLNLASAAGVLELASPAKPAYIAVLDPGRNEQFVRTSQTIMDYVLLYGTNNDGSYQLSQIDMSGGRREILTQDAMITSALSSTDGASVIVQSTTATGHHIDLVAGTSRTALFSCALLETCNPLAWQETTGTLWLTGNKDTNLIGLMAYSLADDSTRVVHTHPDNVVDASSVMLADGLPRAVQYHDGLLRTYGLDATVEAHMRTVQSLLRNSSFTPQFSDDGSTWLITETGALMQHPRFHIYDTTSGTLTEILRQERESAGALSPSVLSERLPLTYPAQDGSLLHGYVSLPKGSAADATPMITLVHGGPFGRVDSDYSDVTQFLVNRGYIVFEPNFRASTGYGRKYLEQAAGEFGDGLVQQDIIDGVHFLTAQGIGDPERLGITGHSFGGSSVLAGLAFTPRLFQAGFATAPAPDMAEVMRFQLTPERLGNIDPAVLALSNLMFGAPDDAAAMQAMTARSPQAHLAQITAPLLLFTGADDTQVPVASVKEFALALLNQKNSINLVIDEDAGHGFSEERLRLVYFWMAEEFFEVYLGGRKQALNDAALARYISKNMLIDANPDFSAPAVQ